MAGLVRLSFFKPTSVSPVRKKHSVALPLVGGTPGNTEERRAPVVLDLCSGMGGLSHSARQLGLIIAGGVDLVDDALKTYRMNFKGATTIKGSVGKKAVLERCRSAIAVHGGPKVPLIIVSGPPCQGFSPAGSRKKTDRRNRVLVAVARAIAILRPSVALIENVQPVLTDKHQERRNDFLLALKSANYHVHSITLNAKDYGVPQNRERAFFLITQFEVDPADVEMRLKGLRKAERTVSDCLDDMPDAPVRPDDYDDEAKVDGLANHLAMQHTDDVKAKIAKIPPGKGPMSYRKLNPATQSKTLFSGHRAPPAHYEYHRSITVREALRLQGFPDDFRVYGSFSNQMLQVTNAVPPPLSEAVLTVLLDLANLRNPQNANTPAKPR